MSRDRDRDEPLIPSWDGEVHSWAEYSRRVRLCHAQTPAHKRYTLGPKLVLKLRNKAWEAAASIDHAELCQDQGTQYLLQFLKQKLGRLPVPDVGQHLDDLFVKLRRQPGVDMISWCTQLRETYRRVQRALARTKPSMRSIGSQTDFPSTSSQPGSHHPATGSEPHGEPPSPIRSDGLRGYQPVPTSEPGDQEEQARDEHDAEDETGDHTGHWRDWNWQGWQSGWWPQSSWNWKSWEQKEWKSVEESTYHWEDEEMYLPEILPDEVLGWLLMRRSGLPSASKLSIQAAAGNSMKIADVERAMRQQEDELMHMERNKHQAPRGRSFWIEKDDKWGILLAEPEELETVTEEQVHWLDPLEASAMLATPEDPSWDYEQAWYNDGIYDWMLWNDGEWYADTGTSWISYADMKPWYDIDDVMMTDAVAGKELEDIFSNFEQKVRTFREAREAVHSKGKSRGFFQPSHKGSSKSKGKSFGKNKGKKGSVFAVGPPQGKGKGTSSSPASKPGYTGCFICGNKDHDWRSCPKRGTSSSSSGTRQGSVNFVESQHEIFMVQDAEEQPVERQVSASDVQRLVLAAAESPAMDADKLRYAVLDTGATETVGSLDAVEFVMSKRHLMFGQERVVVDPARQKKFKFGNAQERVSEGYLQLPQTCSGKSFSLGLYTLDVPGVPILIGVRTMRRLGAVIDVDRSELIISKVFPGITIPLIRGRNGHMLLDLCVDWTQGSSNQHASSPGIHLAENPDEKGVRDQESLASQQYDIQILETQSDWSAETCAVDHRGFEVEVEHGLHEGHDRDVEDSMPCLQTSIAQEILPSPSDHLLPSSGHGALSRDSSPRNLGGEVSRDCQADGDRVAVRQEQEALRSDSLRLESSSTCRPSRRESDQRAMCGASSSRGFWQRKPHGHERSRLVGDMFSMSSTPALRPHLGSQGSVSVGRAVGARCQQQDCQHTHQRDHTGSVGNSSDWTGCSRGLSYEEVGEHSQGKGEEGHGKRQEHHPSFNSGDDYDTREEGTEEVKFNPSGSSRSYDNSRALPSILGLERGYGMNSLPPLIDDDALQVSSSATEEDNAQSPLLMPLSEDKKVMLCESLEGAHEELVHELLSVEASVCDLIEVCCGPNSSLSNELNHHGCSAYRVGVENNMDLTTVHGFERASQFASTVKPRWMWFSTPCGPNSPIQNLNQKTVQQQKRLKQKKRKSKQIILRSIQLAQEQLDRGGEIGWEWPWNNYGWHLKEVREFFESLEREGILYTVRLDGCQVGVVSPDNGEPMLKPWRIKTTSPNMAKVLDRRCSGDHVHVECMGHSRAKESALYPPKMCSLMRKVMMEHGRCMSREDSVFAIGGDSLLDPIDEKQFKQMRETVRKLHVRAGHPSNRALYTMLKSRGVDSRILKIALEHKCDDCQEVRLPKPHMGVSFHTCNILWHTLQMDIGEVIVNKEKLHVLFLIDEASRYLAAHELFRIPRTASRNATSEEVVRAIEQTWVQHHGLPNIIRCDPEGCFRGAVFSDWCKSRGVDLQPCPGEDHGQIGIVESTLGKIKEDCRAFLRAEMGDPMNGVFQMVSAHNHLDRVGGFAPAQWAYGRLPTLDQRLFEGGNELPFHCTEGGLGTDLRTNLQIRVKAEEHYRKSQAAMKISRAMNAKPRPFEVFLPGDLVYYRRYQAPRNQQPSHVGLDTGKVGLARWYGPARVLATETRSELDPPSRKPSSVIWIVAAGRLKRCSPQQLRHCSEKEKLLAEASEGVTMPWSFTSLLHLVERGQFEKYDNLQEDESNPSYREREARRSRTPARRSRSEPKAVKEASESRRAPEEARKKVSKESKEKEPQAKTKRSKSQEPRAKTRTGQREIDQEEHKKEEKTEKKSVQVSHSVQSSSSATRPVDSAVEVQPTPLESHPPFQAAVQRAPDAPQKTLSQLLGREKSYVLHDDDEIERIYMLEVDIPTKQRDVRSFTRDSTTWVTNKLKKGAELRWQDIPKDRLKDFEAAKQKEVSNWIKHQAVRRVMKEQHVTKDKIMRMRWIYTLKSDDSAKARIVIIGYEDPQLLDLQKTSPTMSRRTRGLFLTICATMGWTALKGDVKAAFLQGLESETEREVFARPVRELSTALGGDETSIVQIVKACYGLANAPAQWHASVNSTMTSSGFEQLRTEPCAWRLMDRTDPLKPELIGVAVAHVDDFLFGGDSSHPKYQEALSKIYEAYQWSPWECDTYTHCGVQVIQHPDGSIDLDHSNYCANIDQILVHGRNDKDKLTPSELQQLRGVLGALQWRVYQSAPQHGARLSFLQSQLASPNVSTLKEANKLVREVYNGRHVGMKYHKLDVESLEKVTFVAWTDAAVGNRRCHSSTGGYYIVATEPQILDGVASRMNPISWKSGRLPRVARSSLSAEIQAFSITEEELMYIRMEWSEFIGKDIPDKDPAGLLKETKGVLVTDARSLFDVIQKGPQSTTGYGLKEKYSVLDMMSVFQRLQKAGTITRWVHSDAQIADSLTKHQANSSLLRVLTHGVWTLVDDPKFVSAKKLKKLRDNPEVSAVVLGACESLMLIHVDQPPLPELHTYV